MNNFKDLDFKIYLFELISKEIGYIKPKNNFFYKNKNEILESYCSVLKEVVVKKLNLNLKDMSQIKYLEDCIDSAILNCSTGLIENVIREQFIKQGMFALITLDFLNCFSSLLKGQRVLELMGGRGYLSKGLLERGVDIHCTDDRSWDVVKSRAYCKVENLDALKAVKKYGMYIDIVLLSWSPYEDSIDYEILVEIRKLNIERKSKGLKELKLIIISELGGCTNSNTFYNSCNIIDKNISSKVNECFESWKNINDCIYIIN